MQHYHARLKRLILSVIMIGLLLLGYCAYHYRQALTSLFHNTNAADVTVKHTQAPVKSAKATSTPTAGKIAKQVRVLRQQDSQLDQAALTYALQNYYQARARGLDSQQVLTLVDFQKASTQKRLWVIDMHSTTIMMNTLVAHGKNSGGNYATHFSNQAKARQSSLGLYMTRNSYYGHHGLSLRLQGLNPGLNTNAYRRAVVIHSAVYVSDSFARSHGRLGRSWGCFALNPAKSKAMINRVKNGTLLYAYYPSHALVSKTQKIVV